MTTHAFRRQLPLIGIILLAWLSLVVMVAQHRQHGVAAVHHAQLASADLVALLLMWWGMAIAMMLPTVIPAIDDLEGLNEAARRKGEATGNTRFFSLGFAAVWCVFGVLAAVVQYLLHNAALLSPSAQSVNVEVSGVLFLLAGAYQFTPHKAACVSKCRSPMAFFLSYWQEGNTGYWNMGVRMGKYCLGCCWAMMLLMFALGTMNLLWMGVLTVFMYAEKNWIKRPWFDRASGIVLLVVGLFVLLSSRVS